MKNANGTGSIFRLQGNRRRPFVAKAPATYDNFDRPIQKVIGYYKTRKEAMIALAEYLKTPYNIDATTVGDIIEKAFDRGNLAERTKNTYRKVYKKWIKDKLEKIRLSDLKLATCQNILDDCQASSRTVKSVLKIIERYAFEYEFINRPFANYLVSKQYEPKFVKTVLTSEEIKKLHSYANKSDLGKVLLLYLYTGCRKDELYILKKENTILDPKIPYIITGVKTEAGKNRIIPIHPRIFDIIKDFFGCSKEYLIPETLRQKYLNPESTSIKYHITKILASKHTLHEFRHTFRTELDRVEPNQTTIDKILGHKNGSTGQKVYTHKTIEELYLAVCKITYNIWFFIWR